MKDDKIHLRRGGGSFDVTITDALHFDNPDANEYFAYWHCDEESKTFGDKTWLPRYRISFHAKTQEIEFQDSCTEVIGGSVERHERRVCATYKLHLPDFQVIQFGPMSEEPDSSFEITLCTKRNISIGRPVFRHWKGLERYADVLKSSSIDHQEFFGSARYVRITVADFRNHPFFNVEDVRQIIQGDLKEAPLDKAMKFIAEQKFALHEEDVAREKQLAAMKRNNCTVLLTELLTATKPRIELTIHQRRESSDWEIEKGMKIKLQSRSLFHKKAPAQDDDDYECWTARVTSSTLGGLNAIVLNQLTTIETGKYNGQRDDVVTISVIDEDMMPDRMFTAINKLEICLRNELAPATSQVEPDPDALALHVPSHRLLVKHRDFSVDTWLSKPMIHDEDAPAWGFQDSWQLAESHKRAVSAFLNGLGGLAAIFGPAGTGKSTLIAKIIAIMLTYVRLAGKIVVSAHSNQATAVLLKKCLETFHLFGLDPLDHLVLVETTAAAARRKGTDRDLAPELEAYTLEACLQRLAETDRELHAPYLRLHGAVVRNETLAPAERKQYSKCRSALLHQLRTQKTVFLATVSTANTGFFTTRLIQGGSRFETAVWICDEVSQCPMPAFIEAWEVLNPRFVGLGGDDAQLNAFALTDAATSIYKRSPLFYARELGERICILLDVQYRMPAHLYHPTNVCHYGSLITADASTVDREYDLKLMKKLSRIEVNPFGCDKVWHPLNHNFIVSNVVDGKRELSEPTSSVNRIEASVMQKFARALLDAEITSKQLMMITPYAGQLELLKGWRSQKGIRNLPIKTVDSCQGSEADVVMFSMVQSENLYSVKSVQRQNVATSRMRSAFFFFGCTNLLATTKIWSKWEGAVNSVNQGYLHKLDINRNCRFRINLSSNVQIRPPPTLPQAQPEAPVEPFTAQ